MIAMGNPRFFGTLCMTTNHMTTKKVNPFLMTHFKKGEFYFERYKTENDACR